MLDLNQAPCRGRGPNLKGKKDSRAVIQARFPMPEIDDLIPSAKEIRKQAAQGGATSTPLP